MEGGVIVGPAALLAESLSQPVGDDGGGLGVELADLVAPMVVLGVGEVGGAALGLAAGRVGRGDLGAWPGPAVKPVHEVVLGRKVGPAAKVEADPGGEVHGRAHVLCLGDQHKPIGCAAVDWVEPEHGVVVVVVGRRVGGRAGVDVGIVDGVELLGLMVGRVKMVGKGGGLVVRLRRGRRSGDEVVEGGGLRGRVVVEKSAGVIVLVVVLVVSGRVGSVDGIGVGVGREHDDVVGVSPFVVQHVVRVADDPVVGSPTWFRKIETCNKKVDDA